MATIKKYNGSTWENAVVRKYCTASEIITPPTTIYADGTAISTYTIKGNTAQSGTPTPSNPVEVNGVGERTENLFDKNSMYVTNYYLNASDGQYQKSSSTNLCTIIVPVEPSETYTITITSYTKRIGFFANYPHEADYPESYTNRSTGSYTTSTITLTAPSTANYLVVYCYSSTERNAGYTIDDVISNIMLVEGDTAPTNYIPYGYKIPISSVQQTIEIYIGDLPLLKSLDGTAVDEISNGTLTRRVDSDGSVLPTPTTTQITMPSIPTIEGANSITVDTTVQPSEFSATWSGWHDSSVKEWDGSDWQ